MSIGCYLVSYFTTILFVQCLLYVTNTLIVRILIFFFAQIIIYLDSCRLFYFNRNSYNYSKQIQKNIIANIKVNGVSSGIFVIVFRRGLFTHKCLTLPCN